MKQKFAEFFMLLMGFRKLLIMLLLFVIAIWFRLKGLMVGGDVVELLKGTVIAFFSANSVEHLTATVKEYVTNRAPALTTTASVTTPAPAPIADGDKEVELSTS